MSKFVKILENSYFDSVTLMSLAAKIKKEMQAKEVVVLMATDMNKELIRKVGLGNEKTDACNQNDCMIGVECENDAEEVVDTIIQRLNEGNKSKQSKKEMAYHTQEELYKEFDANMVVISVPGAYAAHEARIALRNNKHVMMFSDNVSIEDERSLKEEAVKKGLLLMGPDCGTTIVNGVGLCFANHVRKGDIGIVGASGTGLQEVTVIIDKLGGGISQAIGVGGRDLHKEINGLMTLQVLKALNDDENTKVIMVVSKPPEASVEEKVIQTALTLKKPVVLCFIDGNHSGTQENVYFCSELAQAAKIAVELDKTANGISLDLEEGIETVLNEHKSKLSSTQKYLRALYCGGTLCAETLSVAHQKLHEIKSNLSKSAEEKLNNPDISEKNTIIDMGDDYFTNGKPHPMIEPSIRLDRILQEAKDEETAVILLDFELGYGSHEDPIGISIDAIVEASQIAEKQGRHLVFIAYICGTDKDKQNMKESINLLRRHDVIVTNTNEQAAKLAVRIISEV